MGKLNLRDEHRVSAAQRDAVADGDHRLTAWLRDDAPGWNTLPTPAGDGEGLLEAASQSGLAGLVLERAASKHLEMPTLTADRLRQAAFCVAAENVHLLRELEVVLAAFNRAHIPVMLLKGAALNLTTYPRRDLRPMSDLDLLVHHDDALRAREALETLGCRRGAALLRDDFFPRFYYETEYFTNSLRPARIDLHARPFRPLRYACMINENEFWRGAPPIACGSATACVPRPSVMFIHLAAHAAFHGCARLIWLYDLRRFVARHGADLDWAEVAEIGQKWSLSLAVGQAVMEAERLFGPFAPNLFHVKQNVTPVKWRDRLVLARAPRDAESPVLHLLTTLLTTPSHRLRLGYLHAHLWPGTQHLSAKQKGKAGWRQQVTRWMGFAPRLVRAVGDFLARPAALLWHPKQRAT